MISWKAYIWTMSISAAIMLVTAGFDVGLHFAGSGSGKVALIQCASALAFTAITLLTGKRTRRRMNQAKADAKLPAWQPPSRDLRW